MATDVETVKKIAGLAALAMKDEELTSFAGDLDLIIGYMKQLSDIDTGDEKPMEHVLPVYNVLREDIPVNGDRRDELIKSAAAAENGCYIVPSVMESL